MAYFCHVCKTQIWKLVEPIGDYIPEDVGEPLYRKQEFVNGKRVLVLGYCGPECTLKDYENSKCESKRQRAAKARSRGDIKSLSTTES